MMCLFAAIWWFVGLATLCPQHSLGRMLAAQICMWGGLILWEAAMRENRKLTRKDVLHDS